MYKYLFIISLILLTSSDLFNQCMDKDFFSKYRFNPLVFSTQESEQKLILHAIDDFSIEFKFIFINGKTIDTISSAASVLLYESRYGAESFEYRGISYLVNEYWYRTNNCCSMSFRISLEDKICKIIRHKDENCPELQKIKEEFLFLEPRKKENIINENPNSKND